MFNMKDATTLELAEEVASFYKELVQDEQDLSDRFDNEMAELVIEEYGEDDEIAFNEAFSNWADGLCTDGIIHLSQYDSYEYVGAHSS